MLFTAVSLQESGLGFYKLFMGIPKPIILGVFYHMKGVSHGLGKIFFGLGSKPPKP